MPRVVNNLAGDQHKMLRSSPGCPPLFFLLPCNPFLRRPSAVVSAKPRRRRSRDDDWKDFVDDDNDEGFPAPSLPHSDSNLSVFPAVAQSQTQTSPSLRGSDVLHALQRAAAAAAIKNNSARKGSGKKKTGKRNNEQSSCAHDRKDVRPIVIKSEWETRIDELERRIWDLKARHH